MQIKGLGELQGDVLVFGGPCSNLQATEALIAEARSRGIPAANMICTGDMAAYCGQPAETVAAIRSLGCPAIAGNCERQLAAGEMACGCGFNAGSICDRLSAKWYAHCDQEIGDDDRAWMRGLPDWLTFTYAGRNVAVVHGGASDIARFLWPVTEDQAFREEIGVIEEEAGAVDIVIAGHSGMAFQREIDSTQWINAGVIGMPPNDGCPDTRYAVLGSGGVSICRLSYDADAARAFMEAAGLQQGYHEGLTAGFWPSEDILPEQMRRNKTSA